MVAWLAVFSVVSVWDEEERFRGSVVPGMKSKRERFGRAQSNKT